MSPDAAPAPAPVEVFRRPFKVMFQHCDPAGIVFYPRYFEMINATVEDFFEESVGISFAAMHVGDGFGIPAARVGATFLAPSRLGDTLDVRLAIARLGRSALDFRLRALGEDSRARVEAELTIVHVDRTALRPTPWGEGLRARFETLMGEA
jgi:4-hydroxybenzoyl-CoA thioesterase